MKMRFLFLIPILFLYGFASNEFNLKQSSGLYLDTGYRWDNIYERVALFGPIIGERISSRAERGLESYQLGAKGYWNFFDALYLRGEGHYSWILSGSHDDGTFRGDVDGNSWDIKGGLGIGFKLHPRWMFAPVVGWSYDKFNLQANHLTALNVGIGARVPVSNIDLNSRFHGPWVGLDFLFKPISCLDLSFGYELHRAWWREKRVILNGELGTAFGTTTGFSNIRKHNDVWGHLFQFNALRTFLERWSIGLGLKYQFWKGQNTGSVENIFIPLSPLFTNRLVNDLQWNSFSATLVVGVTF